MQAILWRHNYYIFNFLWKLKTLYKKGKLQKFEYLDNRKGIFGEM